MPRFRLPRLRRARAQFPAPWETRWSRICRPIPQAICRFKWTALRKATTWAPGYSRSSPTTRAATCCKLARTTVSPPSGQLSSEGKPLALLSGLAKETGDGELRKVPIFTNGEGRFAADGLKPGLWRMELLSEPPVCFELSIPGGSSGFFDAGKLAQRCPS